MDIKTTFSIKDKVRINELSVTGRILAVYVTAIGVSYSVRYFDNGKVDTVYFYEDELTLEKPL